MASRECRTGKIRTTATIKPLQSTQRVGTGDKTKAKQPNGVLKSSQASKDSLSYVKIDSRKVCNESTTSNTKTRLQDGTVYDFATHMKDVRPCFNKFGQHEPATVRIKNIITQYVGDREGCGIEELIKELLQNSDDAQATEVHFVLDKRSLPNSRVWEEWKSMQGPALCVQNNSVFTDKDIESIQKLGVGSKSMDPDKTGQFGIGFNVVYQLTDCPILLSDHKDICMFDPHLKYVPGACDERPGGHIDLQQDGNFAKLFPDFMAGFLRGQVNHAGCTVFRFPLRKPNVKSQICEMTFAMPDVEAMETVFQSVEFRMFLHSALLFTKNLNQVKVSVVEDDGKMQEKVEVRRLVPHSKQQQLLAMQKRLLYECKLLVNGQIKPQEVTSCSISYNLQTEDDYLKNDWFVNQTFGFHGDFNEEDYRFLLSFYGEESKKFLPVAGVATKMNTSNMLVSHAYSFLPLPIRTGLPVHINGHFAIHSSRRSIWEHTSFGKWNRILKDYIIGPSYCHFLLDLGKTIQTPADVKGWLKFLPEMTKTKDDFFASLVGRVYEYMVEADLAIIPVPRDQKLGFYSPNCCFFSTTVRNELVEQVLLRLDQKVCSFPEVGTRFKMATINNLKFLLPFVVLECLKSLDLGLPKLVSETALGNASTLNCVLKFILDGSVGSDYTTLENSPLCLTMDSTLRLFTSSAPVFLDSEFSALLPLSPQLFLHKDVAANFTLPNSQPSDGPIRKLSFKSIGELLPEVMGYMDISWTKTLWSFIKLHGMKSDITAQLEPVLHLPIVPLSNKSVASLEEASHILSMAEASKNMQRVGEAISILRLDSRLISGNDVIDKEVNSLATPFMLNAALPASFLKALSLDKSSQVNNIKIEHAEILLQYLSLDCENIGCDVTLQETVKSLPIFEDVDGAYKNLMESHGVILDSCIPTHGVAQWMERSNCLLLKEKTAYTALYEAIGLEKKNAVEVYLDDIFPNFAEFDKELRMCHLSSIRTSVLPLLEAYADSVTQEKFWTRLKSLPCIQQKSELLTVDKFRDPEVELLTLLPRLNTLPLAFSDETWLPFLRKAGLKKSVTEEELLECAATVTTLSTAEFSENKAKLVIDAASNGVFSKEILAELCKIRFIPQESIPVDEKLLELSPPRVPSKEYISLNNSLIYENDRNRHIFRHCILCWTIRSTLPKWADISPQLLEIASIKDQPSVTDVCQHIKNMCDSMPEKPSLSTFKSFRKVIYYCLDYLQNPCKCMKRKCENCAVLKSLKQTSFICVKNRHIRVKPTQIILHMPSDIDADLLYPYAFSRPSDMAKYDDLLGYIGAANTPGPDLYAEILHSLWLDFGNVHTLQTNDKQTASLAVYGLFTSLSQQGHRLTTRPLCLPSDKALMSLSTELVIPDSESLVKNIRDKGYQYMCSLSSCHLTKPAKELIFYLPEAVRPKLLSQLVTEQVVVDSPCELSLDCPFYNSYYSRLHSEKFREALWLISRVPEDSRAQFSNDLGRLKILEVTCFHQLYGYLSESGRTLENSMMEKITHIDNTLASARLYIQHNDEYPGPAALVNEVASAVKSVICYNENFYIDTGAMVDLLNCVADDDIDQYLIEQGLNTREDDMSRPKPGTPISKEARDLFLYNPDITFQPKEYVGYAMKNNEYDMVYARVIRESEQTEGQEMKPILRLYDLDTGRGYPVQANSTDMFKESRRQDFDECRQVVVSEKRSPVHSVKQGSAVIEEAKRTITKLLNEVYSEPTLWKQRDKVKKMLLLKWHPDKAGDSTLANEVFKHLKSEIDRVEEVYTLSDDEDEVEEEIYEWEEVVTNESSSTEKKDQSSADPSPASMVKGDPETALIWVKQAECDMATAQHLLDTGTGFEWSAHICCEVIRKMMVSTIIARYIITSELESTRFTGKLFETISRIPQSPSDQLAVHLMELNKLKVDETTTRQPGILKRNSIPSEVYTKDICTKVLVVTREIHTLLKEFIGTRNKVD